MNRARLHPADAAEGLPPLDFQLSPYTGWTRSHWEHLLARLTYGYVLAAERQGSPARALFPDDRCDRPDAVDALEAFARIAIPWAAWLRNSANPATLCFAAREMNVAALLRRALLDGTDPARPDTYWGPIGDMDQRIVEAANLSVALWLSRERVFDRLRPAERAQVIAWIAQVDGKRTWPDNWILFPAMSQAVRLKLGYLASEADLDWRLEQFSAFYRGDGWYADGAGAEFDLYNAWMFGWHYLLWAWIDGGRRPDHRRLVLGRARSFLAVFPYFFGANGVYVPWGRSLTGRFAAVAAFQVGYQLDALPHAPGLVRRISSGCLKYFHDHEAVDPCDHFLRQGFHADFPMAGESYVAPGSPLSACCGLLALSFDADDPFWTSGEQPLPVERGDFDLALTGPGFALAGRQATGQVILLNSRSGHEADVPRPDYTPKYGKFAYSTHFPFNVAQAAGSYGADGAVCLTGDGLTFGHRDITRTGEAAPGMIWCEFYEVVGGEPQRVRAAVLLWGDLQVRVSLIRPTRPVQAYEGPGTLGCAGASAVTRCSNAEAGWEYAQAEGRALGICRLCGYDGQVRSAPWLGFSNINLAYPYAEQPLVCESTPSADTRILAAASLLRPQPFDPATELCSVAVQPSRPDCLTVTFPDGETAWVALSESPPAQILLSGLAAEGDGLRLLRIDRAAGRVCGLGLLRLAGIASLVEPGVLQLARQSDGTVRLGTDTGLSLADEWVGGGLHRVEALTLDEEWVDVSDRCRRNEIPAGLVHEWGERNNRRLINFRLSR